MNRLHQSILVGFAFVITAMTLPAQVAYSYDFATPGIEFQTNLDSAAYPLGAPSADPFMPGPMPNAAALGFTPFPFGAQAADDAARIIYTTDGAAIAMDYDPLTLAVGPPGPPLGPPFPVPLPAGFGGITGLAYDAAGGVLWASGVGAFIPLMPVPPFGPLAAPLPIPSLPGGPPITGLGFESSTGTLWACDATGAVFNFTVGGVPIGPQPVAFAFTAGGAVTGLAVNTTNGAGSFPGPGCSLRSGAQHVVVTDGMAIHDVVPGTAPPVLIPGGSFQQSTALTYCSDPQHLPGFTGCPSAPFLAPRAATALANWVGPGSLNSAQLIGGPPSTSVTVIADLCPIPGGAFIPSSGETLWVSPFSSTFLMASTLTDAAGDASFPYALSIAPPGIEFVFQWVIPDPLAPLGACLSDANHVVTGLL